jgi:hypothetical protein
MSDDMDIRYRASGIIFNQAVSVIMVTAAAPHNDAVPCKSWTHSKCLGKRVKLQY